MNKQATLNQVIRFLHAQGGPGCQPNGCFYRTGDGRKSALGCLIPDDLYSDSLEDRDPADLPPYVFDALNVETDEDVEFLVELETAHEHAARVSRDADNQFWSAWTDVLKPIASKYALSLDLLDRLGAPNIQKTRDESPVVLARLGSRPLKWRR